MGKFVGAIIGATLVAVGALVPGAQFLIPIGASMLASAAVNLLFAPKAPKSDAAERQVKNPVAPRNRAYGVRRLHGTLAYWGSASNGYSVDVIAFADCRLNSRVAVYEGDKPVTVSGGALYRPDGSISNQAVLFGHNYGDTPNTPHAAVISALPGVWTASHRGDGVTSGYVIKKPVKEKNFLKVYPQGDNFQVSMVGEWEKCFDPRNPAHDIDNDATWTFTENPVLHLLHYRTVHCGDNYDVKIAPQVAKWIDAANVCDEMVARSDGGTEKRYRGCVAYDVTAKPSEVTTSLIECFDGFFCETAMGELIVYAGVWYAPTVSINSDHIIDYDVQNFVEDENIINELACTYYSDANDYQEVQCKPYRDEADIFLRGRVNSAPFNPQVPSFRQSRRLSKAMMGRTNAPARGRCTTNYTGRAAMGERFISLEIIEAGSVQFSGLAEITGVVLNRETGGITFEWVAASPDWYNWTTAEDGYGAEPGTYVEIEAVAPPVIESVLPDFTGAQAETVVNVTDPEREGITWLLRRRPVAAVEWYEFEAADTDQGASVALAAGSVPVNTQFEWQAAYITLDGDFSGWSATYTAVADTNSVPPDAATVINVVGWGDAISLSTDAINRATSYRWRFYASDGTTLIRTIVTPERSCLYTVAQADTDGARRSYVVKVAGVNSAGAGDEASTGVISKAAPAVVTGVSAPDGATSTDVAFTLLTDADVAGYAIYYSTVSGFNPMLQGQVVYNNGSSPHPLYGLDAGTYYVKVAAFDAWTRRPDLLNISAQDSFEITTGGGGFGGGGGGYCVADDTLILMAGQSTKRAADIAVGDMVWTQHEDTLVWGEFPVQAISFEVRPVYRCDIGTAPIRATANHRFWLNGWVFAKDIGEPDGEARVALITITDAHTYVSNGALSHNLKPNEVEP